MMVYTPLSLNRGVVIYGTTTNLNYNVYQDRIESVKASILSIDFYDGTYELIGTFYNFPACDSYVVEYFAPNLIVLTYRTELTRKLHLFKLDNSLSSIISQKAIDFPNNYGNFNLVDEEIVFPKFADNIHDNMKTVEGFVYMKKDDNSFVEIENTAACLKSLFWPGNNWRVSPAKLLI